MDFLFNNGNTDDNETINKLNSQLYNDQNIYVVNQVNAANLVETGNMYNDRINSLNGTILNTLDKRNAALASLQEDDNTLNVFEQSILNEQTYSNLAKTEIDKISGKIINNANQRNELLRDIYKNISAQNSGLYKVIKEMNDTLNTRESKSGYLNKTINTWVVVYTVLFFIYYILFVLFSVLVIMYTPNMNRSLKIFYIIFFFFFPRLLGEIMSGGQGIRSIIYYIIARVKGVFGHETTDLF